MMSLKIGIADTIYKVGENDRLKNEFSNNINKWQVSAGK